MEWYPRSGMDDLVVPKDQDLLDRLPLSPEIWFSPESSLSPIKFSNADMNKTEEEFDFNGFYNEVEVDISVQDKDHYSGSSVCGGLLEESLQRTSLPYSQPDYELDPLTGIEQLDDIYLSSLLDDLPRDEDIHKLFSVLPANNCLTDMTLDSKSGSSDKLSIGSSKYLQTHAFSPSMVWDQGEVAASPFSPFNSKQKYFLPLKAPLVKHQVPSEENSANELVADETSLEESVLQELRIVMEQMTDKTRIFFRDALYRLAESSKKHVIILRQSGDFTAETTPRAADTHMRSREKQVMESETNVIDRTIASLMFNKMDLNVQGTTIAAEIYPKQEVNNMTESQNYHSSQLNIHHFCQAMLASEGCDAEVPTV
ncbi:protein LNK3-like isoform X2 [Mangifera indica]|nr:protein LNK3-like isoform X2 [Mangifera indica]